MPCNEQSPDWYRPENKLYRAIMQLVVSTEQDHPLELRKHLAQTIRNNMPGPFDKPLII